MGITYQTERLFPDLFFEMKPLLERHWDEIALKEAFGPVDIDENGYRALHDCGMLHITTARDGGALIGYAVYFVMHNFHYKTRTVAESDVFFLLPEYRKGLAGVRLLREADRALSEIADVIVNKVKAAHDCGRIFERMGYQLAEKQFMKVVA